MLYSGIQSEPLPLTVLESIRLFGPDQWRRPDAVGAQDQEKQVRTYIRTYASEQCLKTALSLGNDTNSQTSIEDIRTNVIYLATSLMQCTMP